jgi:5-hydroxyisourate hydrolase
MCPLSTHVLDIAQGRPAEGITIILEARDTAGNWQEAGRGVTNPDGRVPSMLPPETPLSVGTYRMTFMTGPYLKKSGSSGFYPEVPVLFEVLDAAQHYHVPLLLSPYGYSTYRGS